jgi:cell division protein FtsL
VPNSVLQKSADTDIEKKQKIMRIPDAHIQTRKNSVSASTSGRAGFFRTDIAFLILLFFVGVLGMHVYSVNSNAVQGYQVRQLEKEIASRQEENARLKIREADVRSFQRIDEARESLSLDQVTNPQYFEERDIIASR